MLKNAPSFKFYLKVLTHLVPIDLRFQGVQLLVKAVRIHKFGGPEVLKYEDVKIGKPGPGEIRLRQTAIGVNYNEVLLRAGEGSFASDQFPLTLGREAVGIIEEVGWGVNGLNVGQRVAYGFGGFGGYTESRLVDAEKVIVVPDSIDDKTTAAMMVKGMTAQYLLCRAYNVQKGDSILIHAAAGGVGTIMCQWAKHLGARVIGTISSDKKAEIAKLNGCDFPINYKNENVAERVREITNGEGVQAVYDPVGRDTFDISIASLRPLGHLISYGEISGKLDPIEPSVLMTKGSLSFRRTSLRHFTTPRKALEATAAELFDMVEKENIKIRVNQIYPLSDTHLAHRDLERGKNIGSTILLP